MNKRERRMNKRGVDRDGDREKKKDVKQERKKERRGGESDKRRGNTDIEGRRTRGKKERR